MTTRGFEIIEHPADVGVAFWAPDLPGAFAEAARGLAALLGATSDAPPERSISIRIAGEDRLELLYNWLDEILYQFDGEGLLITRFDVRAAGERSLAAECAGAPPGESPDGSYDVKAITYHQLAIEQRNGGWYGRYFVDV